MFRRPNPLFECSAPRGRATLCTLDWVDTTDKANGRRPGPYGRPASFYLTATAASEVAFSEIYDEGSSFVLYSVEQPESDAPFVVFLSLPEEARKGLWLDEAFIDRGIRKLVQVGSRVAVASLDTAADFAADAMERFAKGEWNVSFAWNTGRCGSTLLHKAVSAMGTASFSEPHWLDQLHINFKLSEPKAERALRVCVALEALTARLQTAVPGWQQGKITNFAFNPKGGGMRLAEVSVKAFPLARHAFMYRACHKVVESFSGLIFSEGIPAAMSVAWRTLGMGAFKVLPVPPVNADPGLPFAELSSVPVVTLTGRWLDGVRDWLRTSERRAESEGKDDPLASAIVIRMDEFVSKDLELRKSVVRAALVHFNVLSSEAALADESSYSAALDVFAVNSQAGSAMAGPKAKIVQEADVEVIKRCVVATFAGTSATVQDEGANILLPRSLGVK